MYFGSVGFHHNVIPAGIFHDTLITGIFCKLCNRHVCERFCLIICSIFWQRFDFGSYSYDGHFTQAAPVMLDVESSRPVLSVPDDRGSILAPREDPSPKILGLALLHCPYLV
uniref:Uncharacterized protein n=1 Tax=Romanomermis culicivorax TaxID=13658 RepID=A0A915HQZ9_ROMCU